MTKPKNMKKPEEVEIIDVSDELATEVVENTIVESGANTIEIKKFEGPIENAIIDILPGKKVKVEGKDGIFIISQKLNNGKVSVLGPEGLILFVKPGELKDI